jgi:hypothetical protein
VIGSCFLASPQSVLASIPQKRSDCTPKHRTLICSFRLVGEGTEQTTSLICDNLPSTQCRSKSEGCTVSMRCGGLFASWVGINTRLQVGRKPTVPRTRSLLISLYPSPMASSEVTVVVRVCRYKIFIPIDTRRSTGNFLLVAGSRMPLTFSMSKAWRSAALVPFQC